MRDIQSMKISTNVFWIVDKEFIPLQGINNLQFLLYEKIIFNPIVQEEFG